VGRHDGLGSAMSHRLIRRLAMVSMGTAAAFVLATPRLLRLGATTEEARRPLPGDDEVPDAHIQGTRATTIGAPPDKVWPWLAQIGDTATARLAGTPWIGPTTTGSRAPGRSHSGIPAPLEVLAGEVPRPAVRR
jgi:hypothetical protein